MYQPVHFVQTDPAALAGLMHAHPLATLVHRDDQGVLAADHIPLMWQPDEGGLTGKLAGHVARANPLWRQAAGQTLLAVFQGPQDYITPSWYASKAESGKVVPTWNYAVVHAHGTLHAVDDAAWVHALVDTLTNRHEASRERPWGVGDAPADYIAALLRAIVGIEIRVTRLEGKWKLSQNRPHADRQGVAAGLAHEGGDAARTMANLVRPPPAT